MQSVIAWVLHVMCDHSLNPTRTFRTLRNKRSKGSKALPFRNWTQFNRFSGPGGRTQNGVCFLRRILLRWTKTSSTWSQRGSYFAQVADKKQCFCGIRATKKTYGDVLSRIELIILKTFNLPLRGSLLGGKILSRANPLLQGPMFAKPKPAGKAETSKAVWSLFPPNRTFHGHFISCGWWVGNDAPTNAKFWGCIHLYPPMPIFTYCRRRSFGRPTFFGVSPVSFVSSVSTRFTIQLPRHAMPAQYHGPGTAVRGAAESPRLVPDTSNTRPSDRWCEG